MITLREGKHHHPQYIVFLKIHFGHCFYVLIHAFSFAHAMFLFYFFLFLCSTVSGARFMVDGKTFHINGRNSCQLMNMSIDFIFICRDLHSVQDIGLQREFLVYSDPRVVTCRIKNTQGQEEIIFWMDLIQRQLQRVMDRE